MPDWFDITLAPHERTLAFGGRLESLPNEWERELAAIWRLEADVNNGAYLQFLTNWGYESYVYGRRALKKIGAHRMAAIIESCQALVNEHVNARTASREQLENMMPNRVIAPDGRVMKEEGSTLPEDVLDAIFDLSYEFMDYPDDVGALGMRFYAQYFDGESAG